MVEAGIKSETRKGFGAHDLDLISDNRGILVTYKRGRREFVLVGQNRGMTCLQVLVDGDREDCIDVLVTDPAL